MPKFPFKGYTKIEIQKMENNYYFLQMGGDFLIRNDFFIFTEKEISKLYNETLTDLLKLITDGSERDRRYALDLIGSLRIIPVRLH